KFVRHAEKAGVPGEVGHVADKVLIMGHVERIAIDQPGRARHARGVEIKKLLVKKRSLCLVDVRLFLQQQLGGQFEVETGAAPVVRYTIAVVERVVGALQPARITRGGAHKTAERERVTRSPNDARGRKRTTKGNRRHWSTPVLIALVV